MKTLLLDVYGGHYQMTDVKDELDDFYSKLGCSCIDIVNLKIGGKSFDVMCDDEGLFRENPRVSAATSDGYAVLVGNLMFFHHDSQGELLGIDDSEIVHILKNVAWAKAPDEDGGYPVVINCKQF